MTLAELLSRVLDEPAIEAKIVRLIDAVGEDRALSLLSNAASAAWRDAMGAGRPVTAKELADAVTRTVDEALDEGD